MQNFTRVMEEVLFYILGLCQSHNTSADRITNGNLIAYLLCVIYSWTLDLLPSHLWHERVRIFWMWFILWLNTQARFGCTCYQDTKNTGQTGVTVRTMDWSSASPTESSWTRLGLVRQQRTTNISLCFCRYNSACWIKFIFLTWWLFIQLDFILIFNALCDSFHHVLRPNPKPFSLNTLTNPDVT